MGSLQRLNSKVETKMVSKELEPGGLRVGEVYPLWRPEHVLPACSKMLFEAASSVIGTSRDHMVISTRQMEVMYKCSEWMRERKRKAKSNA